MALYIGDHLLTDFHPETLLYLYLEFKPSSKISSLGTGVGTPVPQLQGTVARQPRLLRNLPLQPRQNPDTCKITVQGFWFFLKNRFLHKGISMDTKLFEQKLSMLNERHAALVNRKNEIDPGWTNG